MKSHGEAGNVRTAEYRIWTGIVTRCTNHRVRHYYLYGGRGIGICTRWLKYENFLADMGRRPSPTHSIDRIDVNGDYIKSNCRWATLTEQSRNRRDRRPLTIDGVTKTLAEWAIVSDTPLKRIWERLADGWIPAQAVFAPKKTVHPTHCKRGHVLEQTARYEGQSRRCTACKKEYDAAYRKQAVARGLLVEATEDEVEEDDHVE